MSAIGTPHLGPNSSKYSYNDLKFDIIIHTKIFLILYFNSLAHSEVGSYIYSQREMSALLESKKTFTDETTARNLFISAPE